jgi:hypothetical protein
MTTHTKVTLASAAVASLITGGVLWLIISAKNAEIARLQADLKTSQKAALRPRPPLPPGASVKNLADRDQKPKAPQTTRDAWAQRETTDAGRTGEWIKAIRQIDDPAMKAQALADIKAALGSANDSDVLDAMAALRGAHDAGFDRAMLKDETLSLLTRKNPLIRATALAFLPSLPKDPQYVGLTRGFADDPEAMVRKVVVNNLFWLTDGDLMGANGEATLKVLRHHNKPSGYQVLWGAKFSPELETFLLGWGRMDDNQSSNSQGYKVMYQSLSTSQNKSPACVDYLLDVLMAPDSTNVGGRAAWGLNQGVAPGKGSEKKIADRVLKIIMNRSDGYLREQSLKCLQTYGSAEHADTLDTYAAAPAMGTEEKEKLTTISAAIRQREAAATPPQ